MNRTFAFILILLAWGISAIEIPAPGYESVGQMMRVGLREGPGDKGESESLSPRISEMQVRLLHPLLEGSRFYLKAPFVPPKEVPAPNIQSEAPPVLPDEGWQMTEVTYYHPSLAGERMYNEQRYDPADRHIAATNWYPIGAVLEIMRPDTGRGITVTVSDRGSPRLTLDLSESGFIALAGELRPGRILVLVREKK